MPALEVLQQELEQLLSPRVIYPPEAKPWDSRVDAIAGPTSSTGAKGTPHVRGSKPEAALRRAVAAPGLGAQLSDVDTVVFGVDMDGSDEVERDVRLSKPFRGAGGATSREIGAYLQIDCPHKRAGWQSMASTLAA